ncbi:hypothetical protein CgunFtcFv8_021244 [Champsocephalus gunnari]|uniref:Uncharacterized protein n=1 Tax=Champsocephalus gunnari TaxID=52237 RepID=A0AAN8I228_CHAGU|nr:hypothetical protein CgunFtcFv8_021244 [Champsocephalus gunnari]
MRRLPSLARTARRILSRPPLPVPLPEKKRNRSLLQFLEVEAANEGDRFNRQQAASEESSKRFRDLFVALVRKE